MGYHRLSQRVNNTVKKGSLLMNAAVLISGTALITLIGVIAGTLIPDPEPLTHAALVILLGKMGAMIGALLGAMLTTDIVLGSRCNPCGFCFCILTFRTIRPIAGTVPLMPIAVFPCPQECGLIPPGCP